MDDDLRFGRGGRDAFRFFDLGFRGARLAVAGGAFGARRQVLQIGADKVQPFAAIDFIDPSATPTAATAAAV